MIGDGWRVVISGGALKGGRRREVAEGESWLRCQAGGHLNTLRWAED